MATGKEYKDLNAWTCVNEMLGCELQPILRVLQQESAHSKYATDRNCRFKLHRGASVLGLLVAIISFCAAVAYFGLPWTNIHFILGVLVMVIGVLQPVNGFFRPDGPKNGDPKAMKRTVWEFAHKGFGYLAVVLGSVTCYTGFNLGYAPFLRQQPLWWRLFIAVLVIMVVLWLGLLARHYWGASRKVEEDEQPTVDPELLSADIERQMSK